jgi:hypothetical protein
MSLDEILILWSARLAVGLVLMAIFLTDPIGRGNSAASQGRLAWTLGCLLLWLHTGFAFGYAHGWSHTAAFKATAEQTARVTGWYWGGGLYVNYGTLILWTADVVEWWRTHYPVLYRSTYRHRFVRFYLLFMTFQASVVFVASPARSVAVTLWLAAAMAIFWRRICYRGQRS